MAESGIFSAVGLCPELTWRQSPIYVISGANNGIGNANSMHRFNTIEPGGGLIGKPTIQVSDNEIDGDIQTVRTTKTAMGYAGGFSMKADAENLYYYLLGMFGRDVQSQVQTSSSTISANLFNHVFTPNKYFPAFTFEEIFGSGDFGRVSGGVVINSMNLTFGSIMMAQIGLLPYRQVPNNYPNSSNALTDYTFSAGVNNIIPSQMGGDGTKYWQPTIAKNYIDVQQEQPTLKYGNGPFVHASMAFGLVGGNFTSAFMTIDDAAYTGMELLEGSTVNFARKIDAQMVAGSGFDPGACTGSQFTVGGRFNLNFKDNTVQLAAIRHSKISLNFQLIGTIPGFGSTMPYIIDVYLPNCRFTNPMGPDIADGPIIVGGDYVARKDPTLGYACRITLRNTFDNRQMGAAYPLNTAYALLTAPTAVGTAVATWTNASNVSPGDIHTYQSAGVNSGNGVPLTVLSVNYATNVVTYTTNTGFIFPSGVTTVITRNKPGGGNGWSNF